MEHSLVPGVPTVLQLRGVCGGFDIYSKIFHKRWYVFNIHIRLANSAVSEFCDTHVMLASLLMIFVTTANFFHHLYTSAAAVTATVGMQRPNEEALERKGAIFDNCLLWSLQLVGNLLFDIVSTSHLLSDPGTHQTQVQIIGSPQ